MGFVLFSDGRWFVPPRVGRYVVIVVVGLAAHVVVEWIAVEKLHLWGYQAWHPRLPLLGTGLFPLLQPLVVVPSALWLAARWEARLPPRAR